MRSLLKAKRGITLRISEYLRSEDYGTCNFMNCVITGKHDKRLMGKMISLKG